MKLLFSFVLALATNNSVSAFLSPQPTPTVLTTLSMGYVPDGMTPEQYKKLKQKETAQQKQKKFGAFGPQSFKSRSLQSFQTDLESGKTNHLMPMFNAKEKLSRGTIKQQDIPYMQRNGGKWDDSDVKGAKKKATNRFDSKYDATNAAAAANRRASMSNWTGGFATPTGPTTAAATQKKKQAPAAAPAKKKGWFGFSP